MTNLDLRYTSWRKSSYSSANSDCVEVALAGTAIGVRDSKALGVGQLAIPQPSWVALRDRLCAEESDA